MQTAKIGVREFRENLAVYLDADAPVAITRHGETIGFFIPTKRRRIEDRAALQSAATQLDEMLASAGVSEDELVEDFKKARRRRKTG